MKVSMILPSLLPLRRPGDEARFCHTGLSHCMPCNG